MFSISPKYKSSNMFSKIVVFSGLLALVLSAAVEEPVPIVSQDSDVNPDGSFQWSYQSGDGTAQQQSGQLKGTGEEAAETIQGSASWVDPDGGHHELKYIADENGYQPLSDDLPQAPEIPAAIARALEYNAAHPEQDQDQDKQ